MPVQSESRLYRVINIYSVNKFVYLSFAKLYGCVHMYFGSEKVSVKITSKLVYKKMVVAGQYM